MGQISKPLNWGGVLLMMVGVIFIFFSLILVFNLLSFFDFLPDGLKSLVIMPADTASADKHHNGHGFVIGWEAMKHLDLYERILRSIFGLVIGLVFALWGYVMAFSDELGISNKKSRGFQDSDI